MLRKFIALIWLIILMSSTFAVEPSSSNADWNSTATVQSVVIQADSDCNRQSFGCAYPFESKNTLAKQSIDGNHTLEATPKTGANSSYVNPNSNTYDQNAVANFNITNANQSTLQSYSPVLNNQSTKDMLIQNTTIPFKASNSTSLNVGTNKVEFNISY